MIARDAGGRGAVAKRRRRSRSEAGDDNEEEDEEEEPVQYDLTGVPENFEVRVNIDTSKRGKAPVEGEVDQLKDRRARKRRKFVHNLDFLEGTTSRQSQPAEKFGLSDPSSVSFLSIKSFTLCLHYTLSIYM